MTENQNKPKRFKVTEDFTIPKTKPQINGVALSIYNCETKTTTEYKIIVDKPDE
jgi:hypothetical protein